MKRSDSYFVYAICYFGENRPLLFRGTSRHETHDELLKRHRLFDAFQNSPRDFVLGRFRVLDDCVVAVDTGSDLFSAKTGALDPLTSVSSARRAAFEQCLSSALKPRRLVLLTGGLLNRIPGLTKAKRDALLEGRDPGVPVIELAITEQ
jgi:hypothetical protein